MWKADTCFIRFEMALWNCSL
jgi:hypothetical protein